MRDSNPATSALRGRRPGPLDQCATNGWGSWIRTRAYRSRVCCPTTRRIPNLSQFYASPPRYSKSATLTAPLAAYHDASRGGRPDRSRLSGARRHSRRGGEPGLRSEHAPQGLAAPFQAPTGKLRGGALLQREPHRRLHRVVGAQVVPHIEGVALRRLDRHVRAPVLDRETTVYARAVREEPQQPARGRRPQVEAQRERGLDSAVQRLQRTRTDATA